jgi:LL-diaminopimelate aminotransferase
VLLLNYPNNPTGAMAPDSFFEEAIAFCKKWGLALIHDCAYVDLDWGTRRARSILEFPGAIDCAVELHSLSKAFNMTGWRIGWVCGNAKLISAYGHVKDQSDSGQFLPIQYAGARALELPEITQKARDQYKRRMKALIGVLAPLGFKTKSPDAGFFLYLAAPKAAQCQGKSYAFESGQAFSQWLLLEHGIVTVPWDEVDPCVRFSVTFKAPTPETEGAVWQKLAERLKGCAFSFQGLRRPGTCSWT